MQVQSLLSSNVSRGTSSGLYNDGSFGLINGKSFGILATGQYFEAEIKNGRAVRINMIADQNRLEITSDKTQSEIRFDVDGNVTYGQMHVNNQTVLIIANSALDKLNIVTGVASMPSEIAKIAAYNYSQLLDEIFMKEPRTDIIQKGDMVAADMKLDWIGDLETMIKDFSAVGALFWMPANVRWMKAIADAVPKIVDLMKDSNNKFIFTPGVNSGIKSDEHPNYRSMDDLEPLKNSFDLTNGRIMFAHSAGTEAQLKAILEAKRQGVNLSQFKFVFASPRVSREKFNYYLREAELTPDQVLVVTAAGDYPHHISTDRLGQNPIGNIMDSFFDYENSGGRYNYVFLEEDLTFESDRAHNQNLLFHGGMIDGVISNHIYRIIYNGREIPRISIRDLYNNFSKGEDVNESR